MMEKKGGLDYSRYGYIFSVPFIVSFFLFLLYPIVYTFVISFTTLHGFGNDLKCTIFEGGLFVNFIKVFKNKLFITSILNTFRMWIISFIPQLGIALLLTAWFTDKKLAVKRQGFFKIIFYLPNIITAATIAMLFRALFAYPYGPVNSICGFFNSIFNNGKHFEAIEFMYNKTIVRGIVEFISFLQWYGYTMLVLISGVIGINPEIYEAAEIDGANKRQTFFRITLPCIKNVILYVLVTSLIGGLNMFDVPLLVNNGGPGNATTTASIFIYKMAFTGNYNYALAAAASVIMFIVIALCSLILFYLLKDREEARIRKALNRKRKKRYKNNYSMVYSRGYGRK